MKTILLFLILIQSSLSSISQTGTLTIAFISSDDGIYIVADSRTSYLIDESDFSSVYASYDSNRKIYNLKQFVLATSGRGSIGGYNFNEIVEQFNATGFTDTSLIVTFRTFISYLKLRFPPSAYPDWWRENAFIGGGFVNSRPHIVGIGKGLEFWDIDQGAVMNDPRVEKYLIKYLSKHIPLIQALDSLYTEFEIEENESLIGGPISIYKITTGNIIKCIYNDFSNRSLTNNQLHDAIMNETIKINYFIPFGKEVLLGLRAKPNKEVLKNIQQKK